MLHAKSKMASAISLTIAVTSGNLASVATAQELEQESIAAPLATPDATSEGVQEEVLVTGSRIRGLDLKDAVQAIEVTHEDIMESGASSAAEVLKNLTQTAGGGGTFSASTGGPLSSSTPVGAGAVSLRGLGTSSTLTLLNGRRMSVSSFANGQESFVDINSIPAAAIERIEVLPSGASAIYGADAIAGVVNVILRDNYDGFEVSGSFADSTAGTDESKGNLSFVWGTTTDNSSLMVMGDYYTKNAFYDRDRDISKDSVRPSQQGIYPSFNDFYWNYNDVTQAPGIGGCPQDQYKFGSYGEYCEFDTNDYASVWGDYDSYSLMLDYKLELSDNLSFFVEAMGTHYESFGEASPANFSGTPFDPENPNFTPDFQDQMIAASAAPGDGSDDAWYWSDYYGYPIKAWGKFPNGRSTTVENDAYRFVTGLEGKMGNWDWELATSYGMSESTQSGTGLYLNDAFVATALGNMCTDGSRVQRWDVNLATNRASHVGNTCEAIGKTTLWYDPLNGQSNQAAGIAEFVTTNATRMGESEMWSVDGVMSGELFEFNGSPVYAALGFEHRYESVKDTPAGAAMATNDNPEPILGFSSTSADADRTSTSLYGELFVPLTAELELQLAARYDDYSDFDSDVNPKIGLLYAPSDVISIRANWSTSYRAPSLAQVGAGSLLSSYSVDCSETPGACGGDPMESGESLLSEDVANDDLKPESATTWGAGIILSPTENTDISLDYWSIEHEDLIGIDEDDFINRALAGEFPVVGEGLLPTGVAGLEVDRGFVTDAHFQLTNLGSQKTDGLDLSFTQYIDFDSGTLSLMFDATYINTFERTASETSGTEILAGDYLYPEYLATAKVRYSTNSFSASLAANYTHSYMDDPSPRVLDAVGIDRDATVMVPSWTTLDLSVAYDLTEDTEVSLRVLNITDEEPPLVLGTGANVDHYNHDSLGRYAKVGVRMRF